MKNIHPNISLSAAENRNVYRDGIELLLGRVSLLSGKDRVLMTMYLENGNTFYQMAQLVGVNEVTIARRIQKITRRLMEGEYIECLRNRDKFNRKEMNIARDYFLGGLSIKKIAVKRKMSYYGVRERVNKIRKTIRKLKN
ncbi:MAG TPA: transposase family protein [bacterium]|nr:transposase family protein [bacterium]